MSTDTPNDISSNVSGSTLLEMLIAEKEKSANLSGYREGWHECREEIMKQFTGIEKLLRKRGFVHHANFVKTIYQEKDGFHRILDNSKVSSIKSLIESANTLAVGIKLNVTSQAGSL